MAKIRESTSEIREVLSPFFPFMPARMTISCVKYNHGMTYSKLVGAVDHIATVSSSRVESVVMTGGIAKFPAWARSKLLVVDEAVLTNKDATSIPDGET